VPKMPQVPKFEKSTRFSRGTEHACILKILLILSNPSLAEPLYNTAILSLQLQQFKLPVASFRPS
jgi:hypothetical protein